MRWRNISRQESTVGNSRISKVVPNRPRYPRENFVRPERLELSRHKALEPKSSASANSATGASLVNNTQWGAAIVNRNLKV